MKVRELEETGGGGETCRSRCRKRNKQKKEVLLFNLCDCAPQRQEMVPLHTGNELMAEIRRENGSGNHNKSMQLRDGRRIWAFKHSSRPCLMYGPIRRLLYYSWFGKVCVSPPSTFQMSTRYFRLSCSLSNRFHQLTRSSDLQRSQQKRDEMFQRSREMFPSAIPQNNCQHFTLVSPQQS